MKPAVTEPLPIEGRREVHEDRVENNPSGCQNNLELRLGMALENGLNVDDLNGGSCVGGRGSRYIATKDGLVLHQIEGLCLGGSKRCFSETTGGFVHPWSLAARQEKAALEQAHQNISPCSNVSRFK